MKKILICSFLSIQLFQVFAFAAENLGNKAETAEDVAVREALATVEEVQKSSSQKTKASLKESEIPLNLGSSKKAADAESSIFRLLFSVSILGILGCGAFFLIRRKAIPGQMKHQTQIKVLQQHYLGPKKSLAIVRVAGESILVGITDHNISHIKTLSLLDDELPQEVPNDFGNVVKGLDREADFIEAAQARDQKYSVSEDEEFSFGGIREAVTKKLKNMRNLE